MLTLGCQSTVAQNGNFLSTSSQAQRSARVVPQPRMFRNAEAARGCPWVAAMEHCCPSVWGWPLQAEQLTLPAHVEMIRTVTAPEHTHRRILPHYCNTQPVVGEARKIATSLPCSQCCLATQGTTQRQTNASVTRLRAGRGCKICTVLVHKVEQRLYIFCNSPSGSCTSQKMHTRCTACSTAHMYHRVRPTRAL